MEPLPALGAGGGRAWNAHRVSPVLGPRVFCDIVVEITVKTFCGGVLSGVRVETVERKGIRRS